MITDILSQGRQVQSESRIYGLMVGIVTDVNDPDQLGRIKINFPTLAEQAPESEWTKIAWPMAGNDRGFEFLPEVGDEVVAAFLHGMIDHPVVLGFTHNNTDKPPNGHDDVRIRRFKSVSGHFLEFDDQPGKERVRLKSQGGHFVEMKDTEKTIEIKTSGGQQILMQDQPGQIKLDTPSGTTLTISDTPSQIQAQTTSGISITISDAGGVTITSSAMPVTINALTATLNASASATITAPTLSASAAAITFNSGIATFSGVVQCSTLITNAVVSSSYTPGAGNIW